jgi:hypothetical protein
MGTVKVTTTEEVTMIRRYLLLLFAIGTVVLIAAPASAQGSGGVTQPAFYVDGDLYRTVNTPTDLSSTGAPEHSFDVIYDFGGLQPNVATAAPGDPGFNGGRWQVHGLSFTDYDAAVAAFDTNGSGDLDSDDEVETAVAAGTVIDTGIVKSFECPVIRTSG